MDDPSDVDYEKDDIILKKKYEDYQIVICRDGKFVVTFDTVDEDMKNNVNNYDYKERYSKKKKFEFSLKAMLRLSEKFEYPQSIKRKLNNWYTDTDDGCMKRLLSSIYDKYFLVTKYKKDSQLREVYNLVNMELETTAKRFEKENELFNFNYTIFTISSLQLCFTQGNNIINDETLLVIGESPKEDKDPEGRKKSKRKKNKYPEFCYPNSKPIIDVNDIESWVLGEHERKNYTLYYNKRGTEEEILQLFVGGSTVQIWHQIKDDGKNKGDLPNNGNPFLEYIWSNRIPINQERDKTKLRIEYFKYKKEYTKKEEDKEIDEIEKIIEIDENKDIDKKRKQELEMVMNKRDKVIKREDISEKFRAIIHACKALEHLNKRCKNKSLINNYIRSYKYRDMITYIELIVWKFAKLEPQNFRLLDISTQHYEKFNSQSFLKEDDLDFAEKIDYGLKETIKPENNMELAIYHCKDMIDVAYFLEYYSRNAMDNAGWMCTVSKAIPLLFRYNYDDYVRKLFYKECFAGITQDSVEIIPKEYLANHIHNTELRAFIVF
ncbi:unnamed protein product [Rhizophagus irregularis]|nr:unnamed protein product [Rhizophagus irregularis]